MNRLANRFIPGLLQSNLILALASVLLAMATAVLTGKNPHFQMFHVLIFGACLAGYNLHRLLKYYSLRKIFTTLSNNRISDNLTLYRIFFIAPVLMVLVSFFYVGSEVKLIFLVSGFITLLYSLPLNSWPGYLSLRKIPLLKTLFVALVWSAVTVLIPAAGSSAGIHAGQIKLIFTGRFLLIFSLALLFDERDSDTDRKNGIKTIPNIFGRKITQRLVTLLLLLFVVVSLPKNGYSLQLFPFFSAFLIAAFLAFLTFCNRCRTNPYFYNVFLDGSLIIYSLLVIAGWLIYSAG